MKVSEIMSSPVVVTQSNRSVGYARDLFDRKEINALPILTMEGEIRGIVTSSDISRLKDDEAVLSEVMTDRVAVLSPGSSVKEAARMMVDRRIHHVVIMEDGQVIGILSSLDLLNLL